MPVSRLMFYFAVIGSLLLAVAPLPAAESEFTSTLSVQQLMAAGLIGQTTAERDLINRMVADEVARARTQGLGELDGGFIARRSFTERQRAGLDRLTPEQGAQLNEFIAATLAARPKPQVRPRLRDNETLMAVKPVEIHGAITLGYGWGGGRTQRYGSLWLEYADPAHGFSLSVGLENYSGGNFYPYGQDYSYARYSRAALDFSDTAWAGVLRGDGYRGDGQSFRLPTARDFIGLGVRRP